MIYPFNFFILFLTFLAIIYPTDAVMMTEIAEKGSADLLFTLTESGVELKHQWRLSSLGYNNLKKFNGLDDTRVAVRASLAVDLELDPTAAGVPGQESRLALASLITAGEATKDRLNKESSLSPLFVELGGFLWGHPACTADGAIDAK